MDVAEAHEAGTGKENYPDSVRDRWNNGIALNYANDHSGELKKTYWLAPPGKGFETLVRHLGAIAAREYEVGRMATLNSKKKEVRYGGRVVWRG